MANLPQNNHSRRFLSAAWHLVLALLVAIPALVSFIARHEAMAASGKTELVYDPASKSWAKRPAGKLRKNAETKWANVSPIPADVVPFNAKSVPGTIIVRTDERRLYFVQSDGTAKRYGIGVGREGFAWKGTQRISRKAEWPSWTPPEEMRAREAAKGRILPDRMEGSPDNPLGARALYLGNTAYRIHGTNEPWTIGGAVSSGCIRLANEDIIDLYAKAKVGGIVIVE